MQTTVVMDKPTRRKIEAMSKADATTMTHIISRAIDQMYRRRQRAGLLSRIHCAVGENFVLYLRKANDAKNDEERDHFERHVERLQERIEKMYKGYDCDAKELEQQIAALENKTGDISDDLAALTAKHEAALENMGECLAYLDGRSLLEERLSE